MASAGEIALALSETNSLLHVLDALVVVHEAHVPELVAVFGDHLDVLVGGLLLVGHGDDFSDFFQRDDDLNDDHNRVGWLISFLVEEKRRTRKAQNQH